jgi:cation diffusion facilitator family transporter
LTVIAGLILVSLGIAKADAIAAIGVSFFVLHVGYSLGKRTVDTLVDATPDGSSKKINSLAKQVAGVISVKRIRVRAVGNITFIDMTITVSRDLTVDKAHIICDEIEKKIKASIPHADITIHSEPHKRE